MHCQLQSSQWSRQKNEPGGVRTHDLRIKSPLLYQLSYRLPLVRQSHFHGGKDCCLQPEARFWRVLHDVWGRQDLNLHSDKGTGS